MISTPFSVSGPSQSSPLLRIATACSCRACTGEVHCSMNVTVEPVCAVDEMQNAHTRQDFPKNSGSPPQHPSPPTIIRTPPASEERYTVKASLAHGWIVLFSTKGTCRPDCTRSAKRLRQRAKPPSLLQSSVEDALPLPTAVYRTDFRYLGQFNNKLQLYLQ